MKTETVSSLYSINDQFTVSIREDLAPWAQPACMNAELYLIASLTNEVQSLVPKSEDCSFIRRGVNPVRDGKGRLSFSEMIVKQYGNRLGFCTTGPATGCFAYEMPAKKGDIPLKWKYIDNYLFWDYANEQERVIQEYCKLQREGFLDTVTKDQYVINPYRGMWVILRPLLMHPGITIEADTPTQRSIGIDTQLRVFSKNQLASKILDALQQPMKNSEYLNFIQKLLVHNKIAFDAQRFQENTTKFEQLNNKKLKF